MILIKNNIFHIKSPSVARLPNKVRGAGQGVRWSEVLHDNYDDVHHKAQNQSPHQPDVENPKR